MVRRGLVNSCVSWCAF